MFGWNHHFDVARRILLAHVLHDALGQRGDVDDLTMQRLARNARQHQQRLDQLGHLPDAALDARQATLLLVGRVRQRQLEQSRPDRRSS
jgi:hypothetical protein